MTTDSWVKQVLDELFGGSGDDRLSGEDGDDVISGDEGADRLSGGNGSDRFTFVKGDNGTDTITDFVNTEDRIDLSGFAGLSFSDLVISGGEDNSMIDLSAHGGGRVVLQGVDVTDLDASDFLFAR